MIAKLQILKRKHVQQKMQKQPTFPLTYLEGVVAYWLMHWTPDQGVQVQALARLTACIFVRDTE